MCCHKDKIPLEHESIITNTGVTGTNYCCPLYSEVEMRFVTEFFFKSKPSINTLGKLGVRFLTEDVVSTVIKISLLFFTMLTTP